MFDMHSHVLPEVDDGAKSLEMSLEMLKTAKKHGVDVVAATPHCVLEGKNENIAAFLEKRANGYNKLVPHIQDKEVYPEVILGAEVFLSSDISELDDLHLLCYQNTNYILLEMPLDRKISNLSEWIYNIQIKGLKPVIAHIDRYCHYKEIMEELEGLDVVYQLNASEFFTMSGRRILKNVFKRHHRFLVSSDMHNLSSRVPNLGMAKIVCDKKFPKLSNMLFEESARCIFENKLFD